MCQALEEIMKDRFDEERSAAKTQINHLTLKLAELGRMDDIIKAAKDSDYQLELLEEFGL